MKPKKFSKVLIANRGEIACRLIAACKSLGLQAVAVHSAADAGARHVRLADQAFLLGPGPAAESYLKIEKILEAAKATGAQAVHPGYGFLSERAGFAQAVLKAGLVWIGPSPEAIDLLGNKIAAKKAAEKAKVPTLPWAILKDGWTLKDLQAAAKKVGFPLLLKAAAGGGGRGMRLVTALGEIEEKAQSAMQEAAGAFGSGELFLESYLESARHIEVQVFGDHHGTVTSFGERDCSAQRRHQKVLEEAGAPNLSDKARKALWKASVNLARSVGYVNAGTCEYLVDSKENFYFLEMNTRLQVEHPVTELVWGIDLPVLQLKIAQGSKIEDVLPQEPTARGHAIEARLYAEDPSRNFMPSPGKIGEFSWKTLPNVRVDSGYESGAEIPPFYDAMLAKVIAWGMDRESARKALVEALGSLVLTGAACNRAYLVDILNHKRFVDGTVDIHFLGKAFAEWKGEVKMKGGAAATSVAAPAAGSALPSLSPWTAFASSAKGDLGVAGLVRRAAEEHTTQADDQGPGFSGPLVSEYPGKVLKVLVKPGNKVAKDQPVVVCESMKMEFSYSASGDSVVKAVHVAAGQMIPAGTLMIEWEAS